MGLTLANRVIQVSSVNYHDIFIFPFFQSYQLSVHLIHFIDLRDRLLNHGSMGH